MKQLIFLLFISLTTNLFSQENKGLEQPKVDERVELLSIVFRLADADEYTEKSFKLYTDKIEAHFGKYKDHALIEFVKKIREQDGIGYDAVMKMAIHLGNVPNFEPLVEFSNAIPEPRWKKENSMQFIKLLQKFYKDADCEIFFKENATMYQNVSAKFLPVFNKLDLSWYKNFYGKEPNEKFIIVNGLGNGDENYGPDITFKNGEREIYAIMGTWTVDGLGMAKFESKDYFPLLLHEFNHSFVNYLTQQNLMGFQKNAEEIYAVVENQMKNQAYSEWKTMVSEALVRAAVIKYMKDHKFEKTEIENEIQDQLNRGFIWINDLVAELEKYDSQRKEYPTLESYMPKIIEAYANYAENIKIYESKIEEQRPKVISIAEFKNNDQQVNAEIKTITVNFDRPLSGQGYSINYSEKGANAFPKFGNIKYTDDKRSVILNVELVNSKEYEFILTGSSFRSAENIPMKEYIINFKTK